MKQRLNDMNPRTPNLKFYSNTSFEIENITGSQMRGRNFTKHIEDP